ARVTRSTGTRICAGIWVTRKEGPLRFQVQRSRNASPCLDLRSPMHLVTSKALETRRRFLRQLAVGGAFYSVSGLLAEALTLTPQQTQGPFYPLAKNIP